MWEFESPHPHLGFGHSPTKCSLRSIVKWHHSTLLKCKFPVRIWIDRLSLHRIKVKYMRFSFSKWEFNSPWSGLGNPPNKMLGESYRRVTTSCTKDTTWTIKDNTAIISIISSPFTSISM